MAQSRFIFDATAENFPRLVLENSAKGPVLVNYWSPRAGPCMLLMPRLVRLCTEFGGRFLLVMLNTDEFGRLAREQGVTSIPTVKVFRHGHVVDTLHGAESEASLRAFIGRHVQTTADALHAAAVDAAAVGDIERAIRTAAQAALDHPDDPRALQTLAKLLVSQRQFEQADELLAKAPPVVRSDRALRALAAHVSLIRSADVTDSDDQLRARIANDPADHAARLSLAGRYAIRDDYEAAMTELVELARTVPDYRDGIGRDALLALFDLLGESDERVRRVRTRLTIAKP
jgi:putative thioredoxin